MKLTLLLAIIAISFASCDGPAEGKTEATPVSVAQKLAVLDDIHDSTDIKAIRIKVLVDELSTRYGEPTDSIGEYTYRAQSVLHDKGIPETCLGVLEEMKKIDKLSNTSYKDAITLWLMLRANQ